MKRVLLVGLIALTCAGEAGAQAISLVGGGAMGKKVVVPKLDNIAIAQATVYFKHATTHEFLKNERGAFGSRKSGGSSVSGRLTAYLETTDGELTAADYQELADGFYSYFTNKLKASGIPAVEWSKIAGAEFYQKDGEDLGENGIEEKQQGGQAYVRVNANKGKVLYNFNPFGGINPGFAFGKGKRAGKFSEEVGAPALYVHVVVDFADIVLDGDVRTGESHKSAGVGLTKITKTKNFKFEAEAGPNLKIKSNLGSAMFFNQKYQVDQMVVASDISSGVSYASAVSQDPEKKVLKKPVFTFGKDFKATPVVIETTKEEYKKAAAKALERYADEFVASIKANRKG